MQLSFGEVVTTLTAADGIIKLTLPPEETRLTVRLKQ